MFRTDEEILTGLMSGRETAFKELFDRYYMPLCLYSLQITDSFDSAEDIVQDFFVTFWEKKIYRQVRENLRHYLFYCIRNASLALVKEKKTILLEEVEEEACSLPDEMLDEEELAAKQTVLEDSLKQLPRQCSYIFMEIVLHGRKYKEVAEELNISVNSVKTQLSRALKRLRGSLQMIILLLLKKKD